MGFVDGDNQPRSTHRPAYTTQPEVGGASCFVSKPRQQRRLRLRASVVKLTTPVSNMAMKCSEGSNLDFELGSPPVIQALGQDQTP